MAIQQETPIPSSSGWDALGRGLGNIFGGKKDISKAETSDETGTYDAQGKRTDKPSFWDGLKSKMTDDKGLFQGGKEGRMFGRYLDFADKVSAGDSGFQLPGGRNAVISENAGETFTTTQPDGTSETIYSDAKDEARNFMKTMDNTNPEHVLKMQELLNVAGIKDEEGNPLRADAQLGPKTNFAMQSLSGYSPSEINKVQMDKGGYSDESGTYDSYGNTIQDDLAIDPNENQSYETPNQDIGGYSDESGTYDSEGILMNEDEGVEYDQYGYGSSVEQEQDSGDAYGYGTEPSTTMFMPTDALRNPDLFNVEQQLGRKIGA